MKWFVNAVALITSVVVGYSLAIVLSSAGSIGPSVTPQPGETTRESVGTTSPGTDAGTSITIEPVTDETYLVWSTGGLPDGFIEATTARFDQVSAVKGDVVELDAGAGFVIPLDAVAIDPKNHGPFDPDQVLAGLRFGTIFLGSTSATIRKVSIGDTVVLNGQSFEIAGIAPDEIIGAAEIVFNKADPQLPVNTERYLLVRTDLPRYEFEATVRALYQGPAPLRVRASGETPWLRHGDAVLPQVFIKKALGEFAYRDRSGSEFIQDREFLDTKIATTDIPLLGTVTCHPEVAARLEGAMRDLLDQGLGQLVDATGFRGCWNARFIRSATGVPAGISRHAWGAAVDLNAPTNQVGSVGNQDPRLVETMKKWGFTWGGDWLVPDPMHFEYGVDSD